MPLSYRVVLFQLAVGLVIAGALWIWRSGEAVGAVLATGVCVLPNAYFAWRAQHERSPARVLGAGALKFFSTVGLMILALWWWRPEPVGFLGALVVMQVTHAVAGSWLAAESGVSRVEDE